jgi:hypothetical protein
MCVCNCPGTTVNGVLAQHLAVTINIYLECIYIYVVLTLLHKSLREPIYPVLVAKSVQQYAVQQW